MDYFWNKKWPRIVIPDESLLKQLAKQFPATVVAGWKILAIQDNKPKNLWYNPDFNVMDDKPVDIFDTDHIDGPNVCQIIVGNIDIVAEIKLLYPDVSPTTIRFFAAFDKSNTTGFKHELLIKTIFATVICPLGMVYDISPISGTVRDMAMYINNEELAPYGTKQQPQTKKRTAVPVLFRRNLRLPWKYGFQFVYYDSNQIEKKPSRLEKEYASAKEKHENLISKFLIDEWEDNNMKDFISKLKIHHAVKTFSVFYITAVGKSNTIIAAVVFRSSEYGAYVNYLFTTKKQLDTQDHETLYPFLDISLRNIGLATLLLRCVQMMQLSKHFSPRIDIQVENNSDGMRFLVNRGFTPVDLKDGTLIPYSVCILPETNNEVVNGLNFNLEYSKGENPRSVLLRIDGRVSSRFQEFRNRQIVAPRGKSLAATWPDGMLLFSIPFTARCDFVDLAGSQLLLLGTPFFRFRVNLRVWTVPDRHHVPFPATPMDKEHITGGMLNLLDDGNHEEWLRSAHIQWMLRWMLRDDMSPLMLQFAAVPMTVSCALVNFLDNFSGSDTPRQTGKLLDKYCRNNHLILTRRFIFMVTNVAERHWVTSVAIQPFAQLAKITGIMYSEKMVTGYMYYDPMGKERHPGQTMILRFLLNALSFYRDLELHQKLDEFPVPTTALEVFKIGCQGPFGYVVHRDDTPIGKQQQDKAPKDRFRYIQERRPLWRWPEIKFQEESVLRQEDSYNCGVACLLFIQDFIVTQNGKQYVEEKFNSSLNESLPKLYSKEPPGGHYVLADNFELGYTLGMHVIKWTKELKRDLFRLYRLEMIILAERLHVLHTMSGPLKNCDPSLIGVLRDDYIRELKNGGSSWTVQLKTQNHVEFELISDKEIERRLDGRDFAGEAREFLQLPHPHAKVRNKHFIASMHYIQSIATKVTVEQESHPQAEPIEEMIISLQQPLLPMPDDHVLEVVPNDGQHVRPMSPMGESVEKERLTDDEAFDDESSLGSTESVFVLDSKHEERIRTKALPKFVIYDFLREPTMKDYCRENKEKSRKFRESFEEMNQLVKEFVCTWQYEIDEAMKQGKSTEVIRLDDDSSKPGSQASTMDPIDGLAIVIQEQKDKAEGSKVELPGIKEGKEDPKKKRSKEEIEKEKRKKAKKGIVEDLNECFAAEEDDEVPDIFTDCNKARIYVNHECMRRENTVSELHATLRKIQSQTSRDRYKAWWKQSEKHVDTETRLLQIQPVVALKWIPTTSLKISNNVWQATGFWTAKIQAPTDENTFLHVRVATDWVEDKFHEPVLELVQKMGYDTTKIITGKGAFGTGIFSGFLTTPEIEFEDKQISQIKYLPKTKTWRGVVALPKNKYLFPTLDDKWVRENFQESVLELAMSHAIEDDQGFFYLPEGDSINHEEYVTYVDDAPIIYYRQEAGEATCVLKAAASALRYLNEPDLASRMFVRTAYSNYWMFALSHFRQMIEQEATNRGGFSLCRVPKDFDILSESDEYWLCVLGIKGSDGKMDHAIAISGNWIFDSNFRKALELTKLNLDLCCCSEETTCEFEGVTRGWLVTRNISKKGKKRRGGNKKR